MAARCTTRWKPAVAFASWLLIDELKEHTLAEIETGVFAISPARWILAVGCTSLAYTALAWYDQIALLHLDRRLSWRFVGLVSFTSYALAHNIGATLVSGAVMRYRAYSTKGLAASEIGVLIAFCSITFTLGNLLLGGLLLTFHPELLLRYARVPIWAGWLVAAGLLAIPWFYVLGSLLKFKPLRVRGFEIVYPRPPIVARQMLAGPLELVGAAGIIYFALPDAGNPGFIVVLAVFMASFALALISHAPGGLGVLEYAFVNAMPDSAPAGVIAALLVFRLLYLILPLIFSLGVVLIFERQRAASALRQGNGD